MIFFFFKQKTAYDMRISDWSSDVCSSDLDLVRHRIARREHQDRRGEGAVAQLARDAQAIELGEPDVEEHQVGLTIEGELQAGVTIEEIGRAWGRERVCEEV